MTLHIEPLEIKIDAARSYNDVDILCKYTASKTLQLAIEIGPERESLRESFSGLQRVNFRNYAYGQVLSDNVRIRPHHEFIKCVLSDSHHRVATATAWIVRTEHREWKTVIMFTVIYA